MLRVYNHQNDQNNVTKGLSDSIVNNNNNRIQEVNLTRAASLPCLVVKSEVTEIHSKTEKYDNAFPSSTPYNWPNYMPQYGPVPMLITCPSCHSRCITEVERRPSIRTHLMSLLLCVFCLLPCVFLPYCLNSCRNTNHFCSNCKTYIGTHYN